MPAEWGVSTSNDNLARVLMDLDRCEHGRHEGDACFDCPDGTSVGNPRFPTGERIGTRLYGQPIVVPPRGRRNDPAAWRGEVEA